MEPVGLVGHTIGGRYKIEELLGQGGMSSVYRASDPNLRRTVAIKTIHPHLSNNAEFLSRFEEEAAAVAQLRHSNIIQVYDFNQDAGMVYMVMEYVPGETLLERLKRLNAADRTLPYTDVLRYAINICDAANYAHKRNMIHRDIKPANMMLDLNGQAILMDFGIAKIIGGQQHTATGAVIGTALYMSPEQIRGERFDHRTDVYSIGVTLFEMVHGQPPFEADATMALMMLHLNATPPDLRQLHPGVPGGLVQAIEKAMAKEADDRFGSAAEMASSLRKVLSELPGQPASGALSDSRVQVYPSTLASASSPASARAAGANAPPFNPAASPERRPSSPAGSQPRPGNARMAWGCLAILLAMTCFFVGASVLANQFLPGGIIWSSSYAATRTSLSSTVLALSSGETAAVQIAVDTPTSPALPATTLPATPVEALPSVQPGAPTSVPPLLIPATAQSSPTLPPVGTPFVQLINVTIDGGNYRVEYETIGFIESAGGKHIHFFYNNINPQDAGFPGPGPWLMHPGPRPFFTSIQDRPADATKICALVAEPDHTTYPNSGNCLDLP